MINSLVRPLISPLIRSIIRGSGGGSSFVDLTLPDSFPVTLQRNSSEYRIKETGQDFFSAYTGSTIYISPTGDNATGDGSIGAPYKTLNKAITEASNLDIISMSAGIYATPSLVTKNLAFVCPTNNAYIGRFNNLQTAQIDLVDVGGTSLYNVDDVNVGETFVGLLRTDGVIVSSVKGTADASDTAMAANYQDLGIMSGFSGSTSANFSTGTAESLIDLVDAGSILAWTDVDISGFIVATNTSVYIGNNITIASNAVDVVEAQGNATLILDGCEVYGGSSNCVSHAGTGQLILFDNLICGSTEDNIDVRSTCTLVESNVTSCWPGSNVSDNATTAHDDAISLRVGGLYRGGSRTVHDINNTVDYVFSSTIGDALFNDKYLLYIGRNGQPDLSTLNYGDISFIDTFGDGGLTNLVVSAAATAVNIELTDSWPY